MASASAREWNLSQTQTVSNQRASKVRRPIQENCLLVRTDAAWNATTKTAGLGWIVKDRSRTSTFSVPAYFVGSPLVAEGLALREALMKCRDIRLPRLHCEADCVQLIKALTESHSIAELYGIVEDIKTVSLSFDFISFGWIPRENNKEADVMAKQCLAVESVLIAPPNFG